MSGIKKLAGQTVIYGLGTMLPRLLNFAILTPYFTRVFSRAEYGAITELYAYVMVLQIILTYGMETGYFRFSVDKEKSGDVYSSILTTVGITSLLFMLFGLGFVNSISSFIGYEGKENLVGMLIAIVAVDAFTAIPFARLRQQGNALRFSMIKIANILITLFVLFLFISWIPALGLKYPENTFLQRFSVNADVKYVFIANLVASGCIDSLYREIGKAELKINRALIGQIFIYSIPVLIAGLGGSINEALDRILLRHLLGGSTEAMEVVGIYGANYKIAVLMTLFIQMFRYASEPFFFGNMNKENAAAMYSRVMNYFVIVCGLIFLSVLLYMDLVKYFIGKDFRSGMNIVPLILFANMLVGIYFNLSVWFKLNKMTYIGAVLMIGGALITVAGNLILVPRIGYLGSAWTHVITYAVMIILCYLLGRKYYPISYNLGRIFFYISMTLAIYALSIWLRAEIIGLRLAVNTGLLMVFIAAVYIAEREIRGIIKESFKRLKAKLF